MYTLRVLLVTLLAYAAVDGLVFRSGFYARFLNPESSTGLLERFLFVEGNRKLDGPRQVVGIGNSRMALMPRVANTLTAETGYTYASIAVPGASPRVWYYMLRGLDPTPGRYAAVVVGLDNYNDDEQLEHHADRYYDLHFLIERLRLTDLIEFAGSFDAWPYRWEAARTILFPAAAYATDVQDFLLRPRARLKYVELSQRESGRWFYDFIGPSSALDGVSIDFASRTVTVPPERAAQKAAFELNYLRPLPADQGEHSKYMRFWMGKIYQLYRGTRTKLVFVRLPRGAFVRPDTPPTNPHSTVRELAAQPGVLLVDEHLFDDLEKPAYFQDEMHLNQPGIDIFTHRLARELRQMLEPR